MLLAKETTLYRKLLYKKLLYKKLHCIYITHYLVAVLKGVNDAQARLEVENKPT